MRFENGFNKVAIELRFVQFWPETILGISNFEITRMISDQITLYSVQLPLKNWFMLSVRISSYGCTREVWRAREKRRSC